jgi:hypothetical protein
MLGVAFDMKRARGWITDAPLLKRLRCLPGIGFNISTKE